ncbi:unnamed protein product, partial [Symbiodinium microadriaticum]
ADVLAELRTTLAATWRIEEALWGLALAVAITGKILDLHFQDMSILDICFSQLASAEEPLWGSMTPLLNVSCGPRIFHPTCVDVNMIRFSTYAREMENTIVHIDTFGGEGTWTNFVFNLQLACRHLSDSFDDTGTAFWKEVGARTSARPRSGEAKGQKAFHKQVGRMQAGSATAADTSLRCASHAHVFRRCSEYTESRHRTCCLMEETT